MTMPATREKVTIEVDKKAQEWADKLERRWNHPGFMSLRRRMESDWAMIRSRRTRSKEGYSTHIGNRPQNLSTKLTTWLTQSVTLFKVPYDQTDPEGRERGAKAEKLNIGLHAMIDDVLESRMQPPLKDGLAQSIVDRGWYIVRALMNKDPFGNTYPDVEVFDPLHCIWDFGPEGYLYLARKHMRSASSIESLYGIDLPDEPKREDAEDETGFEVWDVYDREEYFVIAKMPQQSSGYLKKPKPHFNTDSFKRPAVPCAIGYQGPIPFLQPVDEMHDTWSDVGESSLSAVRNAAQSYNEVASDIMTLIRRAVKTPVIIRSKDGRARITGDPYRYGSNIYLKDGDTVEKFPEAEFLPDALAMLGIINSEWQQGGVSDAAFGDIKFQLSGRALDIVNSGTQDKVVFPIKALNRAMSGIFRMLKGQFDTGAYGSISVRGQHGPFKQWFTEDIDFRDTMNVGKVVVTHKARLGMDDPERFATANLLREGDNPLAPDPWILEEMLDVQDVDSWLEALSAQKAERAEPKAVTQKMVEALVKQGKPEIAEFLFGQLERLQVNEERQDVLGELGFRVEVQQLLAALFSLGGDPGDGAGGGADGGSAPALPAGEPEGDAGDALDVDSALVSGVNVGLDRRRPSPPDNTASRGPGAPRAPSQAEAESQSKALGLELAPRV